jgi:hypothetical protein
MFLDLIGRAVEVVPGDGEIPGSIVDLDSTLLQSDSLGRISGESALNETSETLTGRRALPIGMNCRDNLISPRLQYAVLPNSVVQVDADEA